MALVQRSSFSKLSYLLFLSVGAVFGDTDGRPPRPTPCGSNLTAYDFIIIGGGTAGLAVAARLSQGLPGDCILVIEAGPDGRSDPRITIPGRKGSSIGTQLDWNLTSVPQPSASNRKFAMTRGKVLGGSSALNLMSWDRASVADFDAWEDLGNPGWNWKSLFPAMLKAENFAAPSDYVGAGVGSGGVIQTTINRILPEHQLAFIPTMTSIGVQENLASLNGNPLGVMRQPSNVRASDYTRSYSTAYLESANASNLILQLDSRVVKVNFARKTAIGVTLENGKRISVRKEVILSAGSLQSPQLLEVSGVGNKDVLMGAGVERLVSHLPGVGENLQDHIRIQSSYQLNEGALSFDRLRFNTTFADEQLALYKAGNILSEYDYTASGYAFLTWQQVSAETATNLNTLAAQSADPRSTVDKRKLAFFMDSTPSAQVPQLELIFSDGYTGVKGYPAANTSLFGEQFFTLIASIQHPFSRGSVHLATNSVLDPPVIDPKYLSEPYDLAAAIATAKYLRKVASSPPLSDQWTSEYEPGPAITTDEQWEDFVRNTTLSIFHPIGTCAMLPRKDGGVVDTHLRVYGVKGLRVVDASIIPILVSGHIQTAVYGIAERAADIIIADNQK